MARTALAAMPSAVPRQPAWAAPMARRTGSWSNITLQSAENTTSGMWGTSVMRASALS